MKRLALGMLTLTSVSGCMVNPQYLPDAYSTTRLTDGRLALHLAPEKYAQLGGKGSPSLNSFIASAVAKERACVDGYTADEPMHVRGYVQIVVRCRAKGV